MNKPITPLYTTYHLDENVEALNNRLDIYRAQQASLNVGAPKRKQGDYLTIRFGGGHCKVMVNAVKRKVNFDKDPNSERAKAWFKRNPSGWYYQVAKHYNTGTQHRIDLAKSYWSDNLILEIQPNEIIDIIDCGNVFKLTNLKEGMTDETYNLLVSN